MARNHEREHIRALVSAYLDGELSPDDALYTGRMIREDARYARVYEAYRGIRANVRALPRPEVPAAVSAGVRAYTAANPYTQSVRSWRTRVARITATVATVAATLVAILTGGFGLAPRYAPIGPLTNATSVSAPATIVARGATTFATLLNPAVDAGDAVEIRFSSAMDENTVRDGVLFTPGVPSQNLRYTANTFTLSTVPNTLRPNTNYHVSILKGLKDARGNEVRPDAFDFSVLPAPAVVPPPAAPTETPAPTIIAAVVPTETPEPTAQPEPTETLEPTVAATVAAVRATPVPATAVPPTVVLSTPVPPTPVPQPIVVPTTAALATATFRSVPAPITTATPVSVPVPTPEEDNTPTAIAPRATVRPPTATVARAVATVPPAPTAVPTSVSVIPAATATSVPRPTNTVPPAPPPTAVPTAVPTVAPTAIPTPAATATPTVAAIPVSSRFTAAYGQTANRLGGPTGGATAVSGTSLNFDKGVMVYVPGRSFYVIYPNGAYGTVSNPGGSGRAMPAPSGGYIPGGAFGAAWTANNLQGRLGYATAQGESTFPGSIQPFENGVILAVGNDVYVLYGNGTYQLFG